MFKFITLFVFLLSTYVLADGKIKGTYLGEIEDKYKKNILLPKNYPNYILKSKSEVITIFYGI